MAIDISALWDFGNPELSEQRFREALPTASTQDRLILRTQIARTYGIRKNFEKAREVLAEVKADLDDSPEANVRYWMELARTYCSATHPPETQTDEAKAIAREANLKAFQLAKEASLDGLAVDALHMMTFVDTDPDGQIEWNHKALAYMEGSDQPAAKKWEGSLRNNMGYALHLAKRYDEALAEFELSRQAREAAGNTGGERVARWMTAWTLRAMERNEEALAIQLSLEREWDEAGEPDSYVYEELEHLYRALGDEEKAAHYAAKRG